MTSHSYHFPRLFQDQNPCPWLSKPRPEILSFEFNDFPGVSRIGMNPNMSYNACADYYSNTKFKVCITKDNKCNKYWDTDPEYTEQYERCEFNKIPRVVVLNVEHHQVVVTKWVERTQHESSSESTEEWAPKCFQWKVITHLRTDTQ